GGNDISGAAELGPKIRGLGRLVNPSQEFGWKKSYIDECRESQRLYRESQPEIDQIAVPIEAPRQLDDAKSGDEGQGQKKAHCPVKVSAGEAETTDQPRC